MGLERAMVDIMNMDGDVLLKLGVRLFDALIEPRPGYLLDVSIDLDRIVDR